MSLDPYDFNCTHAVLAFELRRRDADVAAAPLPSALLPGPTGRGGRQLADLERVWGRSFTVAPTADIEAAFVGFGNGARGIVAVVWSLVAAGHVFSVLNVEGGLRFVDPQTAESDVGHYLGLASWSAYLRVDDIAPDLDAMPDAVTR